MLKHDPLSEPYGTAATPVFEFIERLDDFVSEGERTLVARALGALDVFERTVRQSDAPDASVKPARYSLGVLIDQNVRRRSQIKLATWEVLANKRLFDGRDMSVTRIRDFRGTALEAGDEFKPLAVFLEQLIRQDGRGQSLYRRKESHWGWVAALCIVFFGLALGGYSAWLECKFHADVIEGFRQEEIAIGLDRYPKGGDLAERLSRLSLSVERVERAAERAPFRRKLRLPKFDSQSVAERSYADAINRHVPAALLFAVEQSLATEGDALKLYDVLRVWSVLSGDTEWEPDYIAGWMEDIEGSLGWSNFSDHVRRLNGPPPNLSLPDIETLDQARQFASEASEIDRVWLELKRDKDTQALEPWIASARVPRVGDVLLKRSGRDLDTPLPGLFTIHGWDYARNFGIGLAVQKARDLAPVILGSDIRVENETPDLAQDRLHLETIQAWTDWLADIRVQPFTSRDRAVLVSGALAQQRNPLTRLLREVWVQVGGLDRRRSHAQQLKLATVFGSTIQYVESGGMDKLGRVFSELNVALSSLDIDAKRGAERVMTTRGRTRSIDALKGAPRIVVQIAEDVLAQASIARQQEQGGNSLTIAWQRSVYPLCRSTVEGQYPFAAGPDASPADVTALFGPSGALPQFFESYVSPFIDQSISPWRWKPEARFAGLNPESAEFFERAATISQALFDHEGLLGEAMTLAALAERGNTVVAIGGIGVPVRATGEPANLSWPGPSPDKGVEVSFKEESERATIALPGPWGLQRMLDSLRLRFRGGGQRVLIDIRTDEGRVFVEMALSKPINPVSGRRFLHNFACPPKL